MKAEKNRHNLLVISISCLIKKSIFYLAGKGCASLRARQWSMKNFFNLKDETYGPQKNFIFWSGIDVLDARSRTDGNILR